MNVMKVEELLLLDMYQIHFHSIIFVIRKVQLSETSFYLIYSAIRQGFPFSRMTTNN